MPLESRNDHGRSRHFPEILVGVLSKIFQTSFQSFHPAILSDCVSDSDAGPYVSREFKAEAWGQLGLTWQIIKQVKIGKMCASKWF